MRIYTRTGDNGTTSLYGGERVEKDDARVVAYGTVDEANAILGQAAIHAPDHDLSVLLTDLQNELFVLGADLATPTSRSSHDVPRIGEPEIARLEALIDQHESALDPLRQFILPGGTMCAAHLHHARTVVRRAEREIVTLLRAQPDRVNPATLRYLNRLADLLFVLARVANHRAGVADVIWRKPNS